MIARALLWLALAAPARQEPPAVDEIVRVEVAVTALSGDSVYLDAGRESLLEPGDRVELLPAGGGARRGRITSVARTSARAELDGGVEGLDIGTRGEVWIPRARVERARAAAEPGRAPPQPESAPPDAAAPAEHPPWTHPPEEWDREMPLLAPVRGRAPEDRPTRLEGRALAAVDWITDSGGDAEREFLSSALALDARVENPFRRGGELRFDAEYFARREELERGGDDDERHLRIDRASYAWGGMEGDRTSGEAGRFLQREMPAFGFLDGIELGRALGPSHRLGASVGFLPLPTDTFESGDDLQAALTWRWTRDRGRPHSFAAGYQKTWHEGAADRDLVGLELELVPGERTSVFSSALVDVYTSGDEIKGSGAELTQLFVNATHRTESGHGAGLFLSQFRFPELARDEFPDVTLEELDESVSTRYGTDGWLALGRRTQLYGRVEGWTDEDDSGGGGRVRATWREVGRHDDVLSLESYVSSGKYSDALGARASARRRLERAALDLSLDTALFEQDNVGEELLQHALRGGIELPFGSRWLLALYAESRFGDEQDALSLGFALQRSFER